MPKYLNKIMNFEKPAGPSINEAMVRLHQLEAQFTAEGNKDMEPDALNNIRQRLVSGEISPETALAEATALAEGRIER